MIRNKTLLAIGIAVVAVGAGGGAYAYANGDDGDVQATGPGADRARQAALAHLGGGTANAVERDSEDGATWEVEVTKTDGSTVDVRLDANYEVVVVESDSESEAGDTD
ncbi:MAG TPA: PepSY domain-containing protein [Gaiellaceae bacterium]